MVIQRESSLFYGQSTILKCVGMVLLQYFYAPNLNFHQNSSSPMDQSKMFTETCK